MNHNQKLCVFLAQAVEAEFDTLNTDKFWEVLRIRTSLPADRLAISLHFVAHKAGLFAWTESWEVWHHVPLQDLESVPEATLLTVARNAALSMDRYRTADWKQDRERRALERQQDSEQ